MYNDSYDKRDALAEACKLAGVNVEIYEKSSEIEEFGLRDEKGNKYKINSNLEIRPISESGMIIPVNLPVKFKIDGISAAVAVNNVASKGLRLNKKKRVVRKSDNDLYANKTACVTLRMSEK